MFNASIQISTENYKNIQNQLCKGWNTWNTHSLLCWVHLPEAFALNFGIKSYASSSYVREILINREDVYVGGHAHDGSYSDCTVTFGETRGRIETAVDNGDLVFSVNPECDAIRPSVLNAEAGIFSGPKIKR